MRCSQTKISAILENVLMPFSIQKHTEKMKNPKFSISTDASNKGNMKLFPIIVQYFSLNDGIQTFVLDFYEDYNESSNPIYSNIIVLL